jgi:hypothetical protein
MSNRTIPASLALAMALLLPCAHAAGKAPAGIPPASLLSADGLGPLRIGMTLKSVNGILKQPLVPSDKALRAVANCDYQDLPEAPGVALVFVDGRLARIDVSGGNTASDRGIRLGATLAEVREKYPEGLKATLDFVDDGISLTAAAPGSPNALSLQFETARLTRMVAGRRKAVRYAEGCN